VKAFKLYLFWIIAGVILAVELGLFFFCQPTDEAGNSPEAIKQKLDEEFKSLQDLNRRANKGDPKFIFNPEVDADIQALTNDYLLTERWKPVLETQVKKYDEQFTKLKQDLVKRSAILHQPISENHEPLAWYTAYADKTREVLMRLKKAGAVVMPENAKPEDLDLETGKGLRAAAGFFTKEASLPEAGEHERLTMRFRIMEKLAEVVAGTRTRVLNSPVVFPKPELTDEYGAAIVAVEWKQAQANKSLSGPLSGPIDSYATSIELVVTLQGATSALLAVEGEIEKLCNPVVVVVDGSLECKKFKIGERKNLPFEPMVSKLHLVVLDFTKINATAPVAAEGPNP
jgi:hypothetical protein